MMYELILSVNSKV